MIDKKKLIEDLLNHDGINFTVKLHDFTPEGVGCFLREYTNKLKEGFIDLINAQPTVEVVHGRWEHTEHYGFLRCSKCKDVYVEDEWLADGKWGYCPNCGAKMDGEP